jgi:hypothetical protein
MLRAQVARIGGGLFLAVTACVWPGLTGCDREVRPERPVAEGAWRYAFLPEKAQPSFDLRFKLAARGGAEEARMRLFVGTSDAEGAYVEATPTGVRAGKTVGGKEAAGDVLTARTLLELCGPQIVFERRPYRWSLIADGKLVAGGDSAGGDGERIGFAVLNGEVEVEELRYQAISDIYFTDTFMRTPEDPTSWTELGGLWQVNVLKNPLLSANAFSYNASVPTTVATTTTTLGPAKAAAPTTTMAAKAAVTTTTVPSAPAATAAAAGSTPGIGRAVAGEWFWSDINCRVAVKPAKEAVVGVYFCWRGPDDWYLFRWTGSDSARPVRQLVRRSGESETVLAQSAGGFIPEQWYTVSALVGSGWVRVAIDDATVFTYRDAGLTYGKIGLHVEGANVTSFDDVVVESRQAGLMDFGRAQMRQCLITGGEWLPISAADWGPDVWGGGVVASTERDARLVWGEPLWRNYELSARVGSWKSGSLGLCLRYQDDLNYYAARWRKGETAAIDICRVQAGREQVLATTPPPEDDAPHQFSVATDGGRVVVSVDRRPVLRTSDGAFERGRMGLCLQGPVAGTFSDVTYDFLPGRVPILNTHEAFSAEESMSIWSGALSDWEKASATPLGSKKAAEVWWRRTDLHGDVQVDLRMNEPPPAGAQVGVIVNGNGKNLSDGYFARLSRTEAQTVEVELLGSGESLGKAAVKWDSGPMVLSLGRTGEAVNVSAGGEVVLTARDSAPPAFRRGGWYAIGAPVDRTDIDIYSDNMIDYGFNTAPTDWRVGSGIWEVTNRWQCDPRWSFFSGRSEKNAILWNKRPLKGDFTIEYYVGPKMNRERGGAYEYAQDMNITVCADGHDLTSGYSVLFGGFNNTVTAIFRKEKKWVTPAVGREMFIERTGSLHRKWYHIAVSRKGNAFEVKVNDNLVLSGTDPNPLLGDRWAIWTHNFGMMIARVRVTAERIGERESPEVPWKETTQRIYSD